MNEKTFMKINKKAFTLVELLVVVLIIGILAAIALPQYQLAVEKSRASEALTAVKALKEAVDVYYLTHPNASAPKLKDLDVSFPNNSSLLTNYKISISSPSPHAQRIINGKTAYYIAFYDSALSGAYGPFCILPSKNSADYDPKYAKICKSLGGVQYPYCYSQCYEDTEFCKDICFQLK